VIKFKQLSEGTPPDIECTTDDANAELAKMEQVFDEAKDEGINYEAGINLANAKLVDSECTFVIPGEEAGELADAFEMEDMPELAQFIEDVRHKAIEAAERDG
jgi:hypothetical protein